MCLPTEALNGRELPDNNEGYLIIVIIYDGEYCPHCAKNDHHKSSHRNCHPCEFCKRVDAKGSVVISEKDYKFFQRIQWKECLLPKKENHDRPDQYEF